MTQHCQGRVGACPPVATLVAHTLGLMSSARHLTESKSTRRRCISIHCSVHFMGHRVHNNTSIYLQQCSVAQLGVDSCTEKYRSTGKHSSTTTAGRLSVQCNAWFPPFRCRSSVAVSPFPLAVAVSVHRCRCCCSCVSLVAVYGCNGTEFSYVIFIEQRNFTTAKRQRKNGNGMVETGHKKKF